MIRTIFMGTPTYALPVLEALLSMDCQVVGVYTQTDKPSGRSRIDEAPAVKGFALERGMEVFQPPSLRRAEAQQELASLRPEVIVVAAYGKILPPEVLSVPDYSCLNVHPSLLPKYRGPSPVATAILDGEAYTGTTIMLMDQGMDTGPILAQRSVPIRGGVDTTQSLTCRLFQLGAELLKEVIPQWLKGNIVPQPQNHLLGTVTKKLEKGDGEAMWELSAEELERRVRAFTPWPGLFTYWEGKLLKIHSSSYIRPGGQGAPAKGTEVPAANSDVTEEGAVPGLVIPLEVAGSHVGVVTGRGVLAMQTLQLEGKRAAGSEEFLRGHRTFVGSRLPS